MACSLTEKQAALCTSGIGKVTDQVMLLQLWAQTLCGDSLALLALQAEDSDTLMTEDGEDLLVET